MEFLKTHMMGPNAMRLSEELASHLEIIVNISEMQSTQEAWSEWLKAYHPVVAGDIKMMEAEGGKYFNIIQLIAKVK
ncbi:hypothetical protein [Anaerosphaera multitolerans]|nr:hypothetical protein [Anaerosphaera multitolerans]